MASEPVLSREVGNRTSLVSQPVMVISAMVMSRSWVDVELVVCMLYQLNKRNEKTEEEEREDEERMKNEER